MNTRKNLISVLVLTSMMMLAMSSSDKVVQPAFAVNYENTWTHNLIHTKDAWQITQGSKDIVVAIIDSGVDFSHPDLDDNIEWINTDEIANNSIDDDGNGYVDDVYGWDFHSDDNTPGPAIGDPIHWHATFIAGIIAAPADDLGVVGVAPNVTIMNVRILDSGNSFYSYGALGDAIRYAAENGADVINLSLYAYDNSTLFYDDLLFAYHQNIPVVAVTGNSYLPVVAQPAKSDIVIAVGASNQYNEKADYSNYGNETEIVAPVGDADAVNIRSTAPPDQYWTGWGTSFAAPQVSATIALMKTLNDTLSITEIRDILHKSATDIGDEGFDTLTGYGLLNVSKAVRAVLDPSILLPPDNSSYHLISILPILAVITIIVVKKRKS
ncbi:MAG: S8 family serine peptidase [Candidatus Heimdallarchaeaceae archaeon]